MDKTHCIRNNQYTKLNKFMTLRISILLQKQLTTRDPLLVVYDEASRTAAVGDLLVYRPVGMTDLLAEPDRRYSYPQRDSELPCLWKSSGPKGIPSDVES